jgi:hypothetical protein
MLKLWRAGEFDFYHDYILDIVNQINVNFPESFDVFCTKFEKIKKYWGGRKIDFYYCGLRVIWIRHICQRRKHLHAALQRMLGAYCRLTWRDLYHTTTACSKRSPI